ncbi:MAG: 30S ribosomal protein S16 [Planctomycetota bacterium]
MDVRRPRDGRILEELGTYDPMVPETDARALLNGERIQYWLSVGAQPSDKVRVLIKKYGLGGTHAEPQKAAVDRLAQGRRRPEPAAAPAARRPKPHRGKDEGAESPQAEAAEATSADQSAE